MLEHERFHNYGYLENVDNTIKQEVVVPIYKETKHEKLQNGGEQGHSEHENTKMKAQYGNSMLKQ